MTERPRKEIIVLDGLTILFIAMIVANATLFGLLYRWHNFKMFDEELRNRVEYGDLLSDLRKRKNAIVAREGAASWNRSAFGRQFEFRTRGMKTFTVAGLSFDYPGDYVSDESADHRSLTLITKEDAAEDRTTVPTEGPTAITVTAYPLDNKTIDQWVKSAPEANFSLGDGRTQEKTVDGRKEIIFQWSGLYGAVSYAIEGADGNVVLLTVTFVDRSDDIVRDFDLLVSTLRSAR